MFCLVESISSFRDPNGIHLTDAIRESLNSKYGNADVSDQLRNREFIKIKDGGSDIQPELFFDVESAVLKELNDKVVKDKELVTALTNKYKLVLFDLIESDPYLKKNLSASYSDFKSIRMAFGDKSKSALDLNLTKMKLKQAFEKANGQFHRFTKENQIGILPEIKGASSNPEAWHMAGVWDTADKASLASRESRNAKLTTQTFTDGFKIDQKIQNSLKKIESLREKLVSNLKSSHGGMLDYTQQGHLTLSRDSAEIIRKIKAPPSSGHAYLSAIQTRMKERFGVTLSTEQATTLAEYYTKADIFSPAIYTEKRVIIPFDKAESGALSVDLKGLGAENAFQTLSALADSSNASVGDVLSATRKGELLATENLTKRGEVFDSAVKNFEARRLSSENLNSKIHATGDDKVYLPKQNLSAEEFKVFLGKDLENAVSTPDELSGYRIVYSSQRNTHGALEVKYISEGEDFEKRFRLAVERQNSDLFKKLQNSYMALYHHENGSYSALLRRDSFGQADYELLQNILKNLAEQSDTVKLTTIDFI